MTLVRSGHLQCILAVPADARLGPYALVVENSATDYAQLPGAFTVRALPTVTSVSPPSAYPGQALADVVVNGTGFADGARVRLVGGDTTVEATGVTVVGPTRLRCALAVPPDAFVGPYAVQVRNPGSTAWPGLDGAFAVAAPTPTVTGISPASGVVGGTLTGVLVHGTGFARGAGVEIVYRTPWGYVVAAYPADSETWVDPTTIRCNLTVPPDAVPRFYDVRVVNPGGPEGSLTGAFAATSPTPTLARLSPYQAAPGQTLEVDVIGTGFVKGTEVAVSGGWGGTTIIGMTDRGWINSTTVRWELAVPPDAYPGWYTVYVRNPGGDWVSDDLFVVIPGAPTVTGISPAGGAPGETLTGVYVFGANFARGAMVSIWNGVGYAKPATEVTWVNATALRCTLALPADLSPGPYDLIVTNDVSYDYSMLPGAFTVALLTPAVTGISPASAAPGDSLATVSVSGTGFGYGVEVALAGDVSTIFATDETWVNATSVRCSLSVPPGARPGLYRVNVRNPPGSWVDSAVGFTVGATAAVVTVPGGAGLPTDTNADGKYDDVNGNGRKDFADVVLYFNQMTWIAANEPVAAFDYNGNGRIDFADVVWLFNHL